MKGKYLKLVKLQQQTQGVTFVMTFLAKTQEHQIAIANSSIKFTGTDIEKVLSDAISWIETNREENIISIKYSLKKTTT